MVQDSETKKFKRQPTEERNERYEQIDHNHLKKIPPVTVGEPTFVNPNSFRTRTEVLRKIGREAGIERHGGTKGRWIIVECDGLPFRLCFNIIKETYTCSICNTSHFKKDIFINQTNHPQTNC